MIRSLCLALSLLLLSAACGRTPAPVAEPLRSFRLALFNIEELSRAKLDERDPAGRGTNPQLLAAAALIQGVAPDVLVVQEIDQPQDGSDLQALTANVRQFAESYLAYGDHPLRYPYAFAAPTNTGVLTGLDLDGDGLASTATEVGERRYGNDCFGYGAYPGQYSMAVLSRFPLGPARTFQRFLWRDLPGNHLPVDFYAPAAQALLRLASKSHWDLTVATPGGPVQLWISHPTPPAFDGPEDRNGRRNFDEISFWAAYLHGEAQLYDDAGGRGGYAATAPFVIVGDLNASPGTADVSYEGMAAIDQLLRLPQVQDSGPFLTSAGALSQAGRPAGPPNHPERNTASFLGGRRVDYLLPSADLAILRGAVVWPSPVDEPARADLAARASDHHLVWLDLRQR